MGTVDLLPTEALKAFSRTPKSTRSCQNIYNENNPPKNKSILLDKMP